MGCVVSNIKLLANTLVKPCLQTCTLTPSWNTPLSPCLPPHGISAILAQQAGAHTCSTKIHRWLQATMLLPVPCKQKSFIARTCVCAHAPLPSKTVPAQRQGVHAILQFNAQTCQLAGSASDTMLGCSIPAAMTSHYHLCCPSGQAISNQYPI